MPMPIFEPELRLEEDGLRVRVGPEADEVEVDVENAEVNDVEFGEISGVEELEPSIASTSTGVPGLTRDMRVLVVASGLLFRGLSGEEIADFSWLTLLEGIYTKASVVM